MKPVNMLQATAGRLGLRPRYRVAAVDAAPQPPDFPAFARGMAAGTASGGRILTDQVCTAVRSAARITQARCGWYRKGFCMLDSG